MSNSKSNKILHFSWANSTIWQWEILNYEILLKKCVSNFCYKKWFILLQPQACKIVEESCIRKVSVISQISHVAYEYKWWEIKEMYSTNNKEKHIFHLEDILRISNFSCQWFLTLFPVKLMMFELWLSWYFVQDTSKELWNTNMI